MTAAFAHAAAVAAAGGAAAGYLLGSVPVAVLVGRSKGVDPRSVGDRNPGWWNAKATLGRRAAVPVLVGDAGKGALAGVAGTLLGHALGLSAAGVLVATWAAVAGAMVGHAWPVFAGFRGGRSILAYCGGLAVLSPRTFWASLALCAVVALLTRRFSFGARAGVFGSAVVSLVVDGPYRTAALGVLLTFIGVRFGQAALDDRRRAAAALNRSGPASAEPGGSSPS